MRKRRHFEALAALAVTLDAGGAGRALETHSFGVKLRPKAFFRAMPQQRQKMLSPRGASPKSIAVFNRIKAQFGQQPSLTWPIQSKSYRYLMENMLKKIEKDGKRVQILRRLRFLGLDFGRPW